MLQNLTVWKIIEKYKETDHNIRLTKTRSKNRLKNSSKTQEVALNK